FPGPASNPGPFVSGSWNYLAEYNIAVGTATRATFASNVFLAPTSGSDFDLNNAGRPGNQVGQTDLITMSGNFTMLPGNANWGPHAYQPMAGSVSHRQCTIPAWVKMAGLGYGEGGEFDVIHARTRAVGEGMRVELATNAMAARLAMRTYDCRSRTPRFLASRVSPLIAACKSFASVGKVMSLGCTVVSTVTRAKSFVRSAPLSCATRKLSARRSSSLPPRRLRHWLRSGRSCGNSCWKNSSPVKCWKYGS